ncbi:SAM-dependent methyltransferase [Frankia sp. AgB32]|uniref:SAM-dependent methyltransferase n=1 Tax=Frankia sp. AgB32 TaxID=631119 RepID=UPI00200FCEE0|nr:SAM-dependent methyltransferase [Frankia sp. AgB32]MCK9893544.1 SAM-dependent methyltransferase [Frankia sp. AgB32]
MTADRPDIVPAALDIDVPHSARMYDYYLGGKENFRADREAAEKVIAAAPEAPLMARENRAFMNRAVAHLAADHGVRQFLDIGTGIPTGPNLHEIVQAIDPAARIVYADYDPLVLTHARALLGGTREGRTAYLQADLREPLPLLASDEVRDTLDLTRPVGLCLVAILHFITDEEDPYGVVRTLLDGLPSGSYLTLSHAVSDAATAGAGSIVSTYQKSSSSLTLRTTEQIRAFFDGLDLLDPGVTLVPAWRPAGPLPDGHERVWIAGGVARLP